MDNSLISYVILIGVNGFVAILITIVAFFIRRWMRSVDRSIEQMAAKVYTLDKNQIMIYSAMRFRGIIPSDDYDDMPLPNA